MNNLNSEIVIVAVNENDCCQHKMTLILQFTIQNFNWTLNIPTGYEYEGELLNYTIHATRDPKGYLTITSKRIVRQITNELRSMNQLLTSMK